MHAGTITCQIAEEVFDISVQIFQHCGTELICIGVYNVTAVNYYIAVVAEAEAV